jgi:cytochrome c biogenesis protein
LDQQFCEENRDEQVGQVKKGKQPKKKEKRAILSSLTVTIPLLILLAALSIIGTFIPQNASEQEYHRLYRTETYYILKGLGLLDMYHSWWFRVVLTLLAINLIACSWKRLSGVWRHIQKTRSGYARLGTYLTHLGVLLILVGGLIGGVWGLKGYMEIVAGQSAEVTLSRNHHQAMQPEGFTVRCDDFRVDFYPDGSPREYVSTLSFLKGEEVALNHVPLRVNHPISYGGLTFYQSSYGISTSVALQVSKKAGTVSSSTMQLSEGEVQPIAGTQDQIGLMQYQEDVHGRGEAILLAFVTPGASPEGFWLFRNHHALMGDLTVTWKGLEKRYYTGIQVARNPGINIVWAGCTLVVIGMVATFTLRKPPKGKRLQGE